MGLKRKISITLSPQMADFVASKLASGQYANEGEVLRDGLRAMVARDKALEKWLKEQLDEAHGGMEAPVEDIDFVEVPDFDESGLTMLEEEDLFEAQDMVYDAWNAPTKKKAIAMAKRALKISPNCADAYTLLAVKSAKSPKQALPLYQKGVLAAERYLGEEVFEDEAGHFWGITETRPYMRARAGLAATLWKLGKGEEAAEHYQEILRLNPDDNLGIRDLYIPLCIELGNTDLAEELLDRFKDDPQASWAFSRALLGFATKGDTPETAASLAEAVNRNTHVSDYLLGSKAIPKELPEKYTTGDEDEAILYAHTCKHVWENTPAALEWLTAQVLPTAG